MYVCLAIRLFLKKKKKNHRFIYLFTSSCSGCINIIWVQLRYVLKTYINHSFFYEKFKKKMLKKLVAFSFSYKKFIIY